MGFLFDSLAARAMQGLKGLRPHASCDSGKETARRNIAMEWLIWIGAAISVVGMVGLVWCILRVARAKKAGLPEDAMRAELKKVVALNMGALFVSTIGLMMVVVGIFLA
ncbi:hypothetical protein R1W00_06290 [Rhodovulum sp. FJ3]|nr:hypothetical protein [Rhodovulum sp. FJ3]MDV4167686.1 hypothetical protein [Rhodovulum sp. FJ3]